MSTDGQVVLITQSIEEAFKDKRHTLGVCIDLQQAFDKIWKERLLFKLARGVIKIQMYLRIQNYQEKRTGRVSVTAIGVPEGNDCELLIFYVFPRTSKLPIEKIFFSGYAIWLF